MKPLAGHPGLVKTKRAKLFHARNIRLLASSDARWGELFEKADVMSEGAPRGDGPERSYFGSSNIILLIGPEAPDETAQTLAGAVARDPHVRLRAMRVARREAAQRANGPIHRVRTEITVSPCPTGVAVHVDVEARVLPDRRARPRDGTDCARETTTSAVDGAACAAFAAPPSGSDPATAAIPVSSV